MPQGSMAMPKLAFTLHNALTQWSASPFALTVVAAVVATGLWYLRADWRLASRGRSWSSWRTASFVAGLLAVDLAFQSPVAAFAGTYFQAHVLQHLLLMVVAPPLLALGAPSTLLLQTSSRRTKQRWLRVLRSAPFAFLSHPITVFFLYFGFMFVFFLTPLINTAMHDMALMDVINVVFLLGGTLYWWPLVGIDPILHWRASYPARMFNVLLSTGLEAFLGAAISMDAHPIASMYTLASTHAGGDLLWVSTELVTAGAFLPIYVQWTRSEERVAARADARAARAKGPARAGDERLTAATAWEAAWLARAGALPTTVELHQGAPGELPPGPLDRNSGTTLVAD